MIINKIHCMTKIDSLYANMDNINKNNTIKSGLVKKNNNIISAYIKEVKKNINIKIDNLLLIFMNELPRKSYRKVLRSFNVDATILIKMWMVTFKNTLLTQRKRIYQN